MPVSDAVRDAVWQAIERAAWKGSGDLVELVLNTAQPLIAEEVREKNPKTKRAAPAEASAAL